MKAAIEAKPTKEEKAEKLLQQEQRRIRPLGRILLQISADRVSDKGYVALADDAKTSNL